MKGLFIPLLLTGLCQAVRVYLHPGPHVPPRLHASTAGAALSKHLDLDRFEDAAPYFGQQELFVGHGSSTGLLLTISQDDARAVIPHSLKESTFSISPAPTFDSVSSLIPNYINRAHHVYSYVYEPTTSLAHTSAAAALQAFADLKDFVEGDYPADRFAAFDFTALTASLEDHFGADHEQVHEAHKTLRETLKTLAARNDVKLAVVSIPSTRPHPHHSKHAHGHGHHKRQPQQSPLPLPHPAEPIDSTKDMKGRKEHWAGNACERQDISGPFVLLAGTTLTLFLLVGGSIALLSAVGGETLPSTLTGGVAAHSR